MIATSPPAAGGIPSNFDLPPIASPLPYVNNQATVPFSQLLSNTPQPAPPPPPPQPAPSANKDATTTGQNGEGRQGADDESQVPGQSTAQTNAGATESDPSPQNPASSPENSTASQQYKGDDYQPQPYHGVDKPSSSKPAEPSKPIAQAATDSSTLNAHAVTATVNLASTTAEKNTKAELADDAKSTSHDSGTSAPQGDSTTQISVQPSLILPPTVAVAGETSAKGRTDGKAKGAGENGSGTSGANSIANSSRSSLPLNNAGIIPTAPAKTDATPSDDSLAATAAHTSFAGPTNPTAKNTPALASAPIQAGDVAAPVLSTATAAMDAGVSDNVAASVVQAVGSIAASLPQTAETTDLAATNGPDAVQPPSVTNPTIDSANASQTSPVQATSGFANSLTANVTASSTSDPLSTVDRARFVQRVARAFQSVGDQGGQIRLRLSPPELGSLQMEITVKQGALTASIQADNNTAQQALLSSLPDLRERLAQQDIRIERFDVQLSGQSSGGLPQSPQGNSSFDQSSRQFAAPRVVSTSAGEAAANDDSPPATTLMNGALNVVV